MEQATQTTIPTRPLFSAHLMSAEERERKFRAFVKFVIENAEADGKSIPTDHPLRRFADGGEFESRSRPARSSTHTASPPGSFSTRASHSPGS